MPDHFFVSMRDAGRTALILGPFTSEEQCRKYAYIDPADGGSYQDHISVLDTIYKIDPKSHFYSTGMLKVKGGIDRKGILNRVDPVTWDGVLA